MFYARAPTRGMGSEILRQPAKTATLYNQQYCPYSSRVTVVHHCQPLLARSSLDFVATRGGGGGPPARRERSTESTWEEGAPSFLRITGRTQLPSDEAAASASVQRSPRPLGCYSRGICISPRQGGGREAKRRRASCIAFVSSPKAEAPTRTLCHRRGEVGARELAQRRQGFDFRRRAVHLLKCCCWALTRLPFLGKWTRGGCGLT